VDFCREALDDLESQVAARGTPLRYGAPYPDANQTIIHSSIEFVEADLKRLPFLDASVDFILDKGATDAALRSKDAGGGRGRGDDNFRQSFNEFLRVLRRDRIGGILHISDEDPDVRLPFLDHHLRSIWNRNNNNDHDNQDYYSVSVQTLELDGREIFSYYISSNA